jgi:glycosyltransferase involved in cell wall biosynthesis
MHKLLIVFDVCVDSPKGKLGWAYYNKACGIQRNAPPDFDVDICAYADIPWDRINHWDAILNLEYASPLGPRLERLRNHGVSNVTMYSSSRPVNVTMYNKCEHSYFQRWKMARRYSDFVICSTKSLFDFTGRQLRTCHIANGICADTYRITTPIQDREHRVWWRGSSNPKKGKGWDEVLVPAIPKLEKLGFIVDFKPVNEIVPEQVLNTPEMTAAYNSASYAVCTSMSEGAPSSILEAAACGCVVVSTNVGNLPEWGEDGKNCVVIPRSVDGLVEGLCRARENREKLSAAGAETMHEKWSYSEPGCRASYFYNLMRRAIQDGVDSIEPFSHLEKHWSEI